MNKIINTDPLIEFFQKDITPASMAETIERVVFNYAQYMLKDRDSCGAREQEAADIYWLNEQRELLRKMDEED